MDRNKMYTNLMANHTFLLSQYIIEAMNTHTSLSFCFEHFLELSSP